MALARHRLAAAVAIALAALCVASAAADAPVRSAAVRLDRIGRFTSPVYVTAPPGDTDRLFVVEQPGTIRVVRNGRKLSVPFLDLRRRVLCCGERGLLSMAFAPDYASSRRFYVYFTERPSGALRVLEYRADANDPDRAVAGSARGIVKIGHSRFPNHNGGQLQFGPDGLLYIGTGDGGGGGDPFRNGQNRRSLLGKILRIDPLRSHRPSVYSYGLRNPFRFSFDRSTGDLTIGDVGQDAIEEIDFARQGRGRGANFGWSIFEGTRRFRSGSARGHRRPALQHSHSAGWCSIIGGYVVRDRSLTGMFGRYVYGDYCKGQIYSAELATGRAAGDRPLGLRVPSLSSFGEDADGHVYATSLAGSVYRLRSR